MRICVAGAYGAFGIKHLDALANIEGVEVTSVMGPTKAKIEALAAERGIGHAATTLDECLGRDDRVAGLVDGGEEPRDTAAPHADARPGRCARSATATCSGSKILRPSKITG